MVKLSIDSKEILEKIAKEVHNQWCNWTKYFLSQMPIPASPSLDYQRWRTQMRCSYAELSEEDKEKDRIWALNFLPIVLEIEQIEKGRKMKAFDKLKERIKEHRRNCIGWKKMKPCFNCHVNTLTEIEEEINGRNKD